MIRVLPSANAASRMCAGTACRPSLVAAKTGGIASSDIIAPAARNERPYTPPPSAVNDSGENTPSWKIARPNSAITMSGVPATISMLDSTTRASQLGRPYSAIHTALATASGSARTMPMTVSSSVPSSGSRKPPEPAWLELTCGRLNSRPGRRYWIPR